MEFNKPQHAIEGLIIFTTVLLHPRRSQLVSKIVFDPCQQQYDGILNTNITKEGMYLFFFFLTYVLDCFQYRGFIFLDYVFRP